MLKEEFVVKNGKIIRTVNAGKYCGVTDYTVVGQKYLNFECNSHVWWSSFLRTPRLSLQGKQQLNIVDLFSSVGGLSLGAHEAFNAVGNDPISLLCTDMDEEAINVYKRNFNPKVALHNNVSSLIDYHIYGRGETAELAYYPEIINEHLSKCTGITDLLIAGPPCQGHSNLNNHTRGDDPRNLLYLASASIGLALKARAIVIENVPSVIKDVTNVVLTVKTILKANGYVVSDGVLSASSLGAAQTRRRHFLIATLKEHIDVNEAARILKKPPMVLGEILNDILAYKFEDPMYRTPELSAENRDRINYLFDNNLYDLPNKVRPDCHKNGHTYPSVYGRLYWDRPSPTITTGFLTPGRGRFIHPLDRRVINPREAARIQGFPDWFDFSGDQYAVSRQSLSKWIGDAVPTPLGYSAVLTALTGM